ncbi:hypothetical protein VTO42DRAFT_7964 [Malbranchea cinnamomea]
MPCELLRTAGQLFLWLWLLLRSSFASAKANFPVPWSPEKYGPDGPWQAVRVRVGGNDPEIRYELQSVAVDLLPGGTYSSYILTPQACEPFINDACGAGGLWDPRGVSAFPISWRAAFRNAATNQTSGGSPFMIQAMTINEHTVWNSSLVAVDNVTITMPNGNTRGPLLGQLSLGGEKTVQGFTRDDRKVGTSDAYIFSGGLYDQGVIPSYSYGLHIGSAAHNYPGSLVFGGYDKGRVIGPYTTFSDWSITLLDIGIGVETGASPFPFKSKTGLLVSNTSSPQALSVAPDPTVPYLHLPPNTCEAIVEHLPVSMDPATGYYLWDTDDPRFKTITTSPSYLSFTFPPASGSTDEVVIKVPFALLNLTLEKPIVSGSPRSYFPCSSFTPQSGDSYRLGRAFLQAAFLGRNWFTKVSWLAQAPGPGLQRQGLGTQFHDIPDRATTIEYFDPKGQFARSWEMYWTPLEGNETDDNAPLPSASGVPQSTNLSNTAKIGIGVGCGIGGIIVISGILTFLIKTRRLCAGTTPRASEAPQYCYPAGETLAREIKHPLELQDRRHQVYEVDGTSTFPPLFELGHSTPRVTSLREGYI